MPSVNNPAGRLHSILREAKRRNEHRSIKVAWSEVFGLPDSDLSSILIRLVELDGLLRQVEEEVQKLDVKKDIYLKHVPALRSAILASNLDENWSEKRNLLTEQALDSLEFCSERLEALRPEPTLDETQINEIKLEVDELFETIEEADIPEELKAVLLGILGSMQESIAQYRIRGLEGLRQEWFYIRARLERHATAILGQRENPIVVRFMKTLQNWDTISSLYVNTKQIAGEVFKMIGTNL